MEINHKCAGQLIAAYCDYCRWAGDVTVPKRYKVPECGPMEQSCPYCGNCYLHPQPEGPVDDIVYGVAYRNREVVNGEYEADD